MRFQARHWDLSTCVLNLKPLRTSRLHGLVQFIRPLDFISIQLNIVPLRGHARVSTFSRLSTFSQLYKRNMTNVANENIDCS